MNDISHAAENSPRREELSGILLESVEAVIREPVKQESLARALERARQIEQSQVTLPRRSRMLRRILVFSALAATLLLAVFIFLNRESSAWAQVVEAVAKKPWLHYVKTYDDGTKMEAWFSARRCVLAARTIKVGSKLIFGNDPEGRVVFDMSQNTRDSYDREKNIVVRTSDDPFREGANTWEAIFSAFLSGNLGETIDAGRFQLIPDQQRVVVEGEKRWIEHRLIQRGKNENAMFQHEWIVLVDPDTQLPFRWEQATRLASDPSKVVGVGGRNEIDYPATGPEDIYALGVPKTAKVIDRTLRSDVEKLAKETVAPGHWADDKFSALVIESWENQEWWQGHSIYRVWKEGLCWKIDHSMGPVEKPFDKPPPKETDQGTWWRQKAKKFPFTPDSVSDGKSYWSYETKTRRPTPADTAAGWPENTMVIVSTEKHRQPAFPVEKDRFYVCYPLGWGRPTDPNNDLMLLPGMESSVDPKPKSGPSNTVLLEVCNPNWKPRGSAEFSVLKQNPQFWRFWIDPSRDYLVMRREELIIRDGKETLTGGFAIEAVSQDPRGRWYPIVVRRFKCNTDKWEDELLRFYYDFNAKMPEDW